MTIIKLICEIVGAIALIGILGMMISLAVARVAKELKILSEFEKDYEDDF